VAARLEKSVGYQGDAMNLPVPDLAAALPFYESVLGFRVVSRRDAPYRSAVLGRDGVQIGLTENGGNPSQDGCAFHVRDLPALFAELNARGLGQDGQPFRRETHDAVSWSVFYAVAPDGLCYWFGEKQE
jgi:catechol 2,3-dioxygenase-like lactoylglutathione lyase family enzyme